MKLSFLEFCIKKPQLIIKEVDFKHIVLASILFFGTNFSSATSATLGFDVATSLGSSSVSSTRTIGREFTLSETKIVSGLGYFSKFEGDLNAPAIEVGLWNSTGTLLGNVPLQIIHERSHRNYQTINGSSKIYH